MRSLADHPLLADAYRAGLAAGRDPAAPASEGRASVRAPADDLLWDLLVNSPFSDEAAGLADFAEVRFQLPALEARAREEGFKQGLREVLAQRVAERFRPPRKRWESVLRQSSRAQLEAMLSVLPACRTWADFLSRAVRP